MEASLVSLTSFVVRAYLPCWGRRVLVMGRYEWDLTWYLQRLTSFSPAGKALSSKDEIVVVSDAIVRRVMVIFMAVSDWKRLLQVGRYEKSRATENRCFQCTCAIQAAVRCPAQWQRRGF